ncbi:hypothetical protein BoBH3_16965 [Bosea sp. BH3]|nr:hypothetical protein [Bosea sp. BH3]
MRFDAHFGSQPHLKFESLKSAMDNMMTLPDAGRRAAVIMGLIGQDGAYLSELLLQRDMMCKA